VGSASNTRKRDPRSGQPASTRMIERAARCRPRAEGAPAHASPRPVATPSPTRARHSGNPGMARPSIDHEHRGLHGLGAEQVQGQPAARVERHARAGRVNFMPSSKDQGGRPCALAGASCRAPRRGSPCPRWLCGRHERGESNGDRHGGERQRSASLRSSASQRGAQMGLVVAFGPVARSPGAISTKGSYPLG
jgi:hypothetical protein